MTLASVAIEPGARARLRHAEHASGLFLPAGTIGEIVSRHRLHARVAVLVDGHRRVLRLPLASLEIAPG